MAHLRRLVIHKFRNVAPGTVLEFSPGKNVLLGKNGTGKTTLLELISTALRDEFWTRWREPVDLEYEIASREGSGRLLVHVRTIPAESASADGFEQERDGDLFETTASLKINTGEEETDFRAEIRGDEIQGNRGTDQLRTRFNPRRGRSRVLVALVDLVSYFEADSDMNTALRPIRGLIREFRDGLPHPIRFDEALEFFTTLTDENHSDAPELAVRGAGTSTVRFTNNAIVSGAISQAVRAVDANPFPNQLIMGDQEFPFLRCATRLLGIAAAWLYISLRDQRPAGDGYALRYRGFAFFFTKRDGSRFWHDKLSYGQKRLLAFLYYLDLNPSVVIADELVNGFHQEWIRECMSLLGDRQAFLTSQNPLLLDYLTIDDADTARKSFVLCESREETADDGRVREVFTWRNMTEDEAASFYSAYDAGIQHVGEILRDKGLW